MNLATLSLSPAFTSLLRLQLTLTKAILKPSHLHSGNSPLLPSSRPSNGIYHRGGKEWPHYSIHRTTTGLQPLLTAYNTHPIFFTYQQLLFYPDFATFLILYLFQCPPVSVLLALTYSSSPSVTKFITYQVTTASNPPI